MGKTTRRVAGDGALYQRGDGMWIGSVELGYGTDGKRRRKTVSSRTQKDALAKLREVRAQVAGGLDVPTSSTTLSAWLDYWLREIAAKRVRPRTLDTYRHKVALIKEASGRARLDRLTPAHVRAVAQLCEDRGLSSTTALQAHAILSASLKDALREGRVTRNVAELVDRPSKAASTRGALTAEQAVHLLRVHADHPLVSRWAFALTTGARQGEALGLRWPFVTDDSIDLAWQLQRLAWRHGCREAEPDHSPRTCPRRTLAIPSSMEHEVVAGALVLTRPKTKAGIRVLPAVPFVAAALDARRQVAVDNPWGLVWTDEAGRPIHPSADSAAWHSALEQAGLPRVPLHAARHTAATLLLEAGVDAKVATTILGHSDVVVTRGYQHADLRLARDALERVSRLLEAS